MANKNKCGTCGNFYPMVKGQRDGTTKKTKRGYCLDKSIFASNRTGKEVIPPKAKTDELPHGRHNLYVVHLDDVVENCQKYL